MRSAERLFLYAAVTTALLLALRAAPLIGPAAHAASPGRGEAPRIAVCAVYSIADALMDSDRFRPERVEFEQELRRESLAPLMEELKRLQKQLEAADRKDANFQELRERYFRQQGVVSRATQEIAKEVEKKVADQLVECYHLVRAAAADVAEDLGYDFVLASNGADEDLRKDSVSGLMRDILGRPVLVSPAEVDITDDVRAHLKLE